MNEPDYIYYPARVERIGGDSVTVKVNKEGEDSTVSVPGNHPLMPLHEDSLHDVEDLCRLPDCCEPALLHNTRLRYWKDTIYSYIGPILVSVNPYKRLPMYTPAIMAGYRGKDTADLAPHLFALAERSMVDMLKTRKDQTFVISGESGAGKSEATKFVVHYLADASLHMVKAASPEIVNRVLDVTPVLEALGNAKTVRNDNSSRFGKWMQIYFSADGEILSAAITKYLLEKSRVALPLPDERNYHIFYQMIAGLDPAVKRDLGLGAPEDYTYLTEGGCTSVPSINDKDDYLEVVKGFKQLAMSDDLIHSIWSLLTAVLKLGNIKIGQNAKDEATVDKASLEPVAKLLYTTANELEAALCFRTMSVSRGSSYTIPRNQQQCKDTCDAFAKYLYSSLFDWMIDDFINDSLKGKPAKGKPACIGVLDIFGFESLLSNSFEQLCINYTNEKLQQFFNEFIFKLEKKIYEAERVEYKDIEFPDNTEVLALIEAKATGLLAMIDEECALPKGTDAAFKDKVLSNHKATKDKTGKLLCMAPKVGKDNKDCFNVIHYAGVVMYHTEGWIDKNRDLLGDDLGRVLKLAKHEFIKRLAPQYDENAAKQGKVKTIAASFKNSLEALMTSLRGGDPFFVRCVKPNLMKEPNNFNDDLVLTQLRYCGMLEAIRVRRAGFPFRYLYHDFLGRFKCCAPHAKGGTPKEHAQDVLSKAEGIGKDEWRLGVTKAFLNNKCFLNLEALRVKMLYKVVVRMQKVVRGHLGRRWYKKAKVAIRKLQAVGRGMNARKMIVVVSKLKKAMTMGTIQEIQQAINAAKPFSSIKRVEELMTQAAESMRNVLERDACRKALADASASENREALEAALYKAKAIKLAPAVPELVKANEVLAKVVARDNALAMLRDAIGHEEPSVSELEAALAVADKGGLTEAMTPEIGEAKKMIVMLAEQKSATENLRKAVASGDEAELDGAIQKAEKFEKILKRPLEEARKALALVRKHKALNEELQAAISSKNQKELQQAINDARDHQYDGPLFAKAEQVLATVIAELDITDQIRSAIAMRDAKKVEELIARAKAQGLNVPSDVTGSASEYLERVEKEKACMARLEKALTSSSLREIDSVLLEAEQLNLRTPLLQMLQKRAYLIRRQENLVKIIDDYKSVDPSSAERKAFRKQLKDAVREFEGDDDAAGLEKVEEARQLLAQSAEEEKVELLLKTALGTKNLAQIQVGLFKADQMTMRSKVINVSVELREAMEEDDRAELNAAVKSGDDDKILEATAKGNKEYLAKLREAHGRKAPSVQRTQRSKSIKSSTDIVLKGTAGIAVEGGKNLKAASGKEMIKAIRENSELDKKINELLEEDKKNQQDQDDVLYETVLLLKDTLPDLFHRDLKDEPDLIQLFEEFKTTYPFEDCQVLRAKKCPAFSALPMKNSLTIIPADQAEYATNLFKSILGYLGIKKLPFPSTLAEEIVMTGLEVPPLRDEIFMMIIKQTNSAADDISGRLERSADDDLWGLMFVCLLAFRPTDALYPYFLAYLTDYCFRFHAHEREVLWPRVCLRLAVNNEVTQREFSEMKTKLPKDTRDAIVNKRICVVTGKEWYITQREQEMWARKGKPIPDRCQEARVQLDGQVRPTRK